MSAQLRFRTLVKHAGSIYDAAKEARTGLLMSSLDDIVEKINPHEAADWHKVRHDTQRVLKVWLSREQTHAAQMLADQLMDSLAEFSEEPVTAIVAAAPPLPHLEIVEKPAPAHVSVATLLTKQIETDSIEDEDEDEDEDDVLVASDDEDEDEDEEDEDDEPAPAVNKPAPAPEAEDDSDEEVLEPEADAVAPAEDEEEGMEVEKRTIRGRDYWIDVNTQKLYAVIDDDDVGDEVGAIVNGRPVFLSA